MNKTELLVWKIEDALRETNKSLKEVESWLKEVEGLFRELSHQVEVDK